MPDSPKGDLQFLQALSEPEFSELVFIPLLSAMGYVGIRYNHGSGELGKDVVFGKQDPIDGLRFMSATIKMQPISGAVTGSRALREVFFQLSQSLQEPFLDPQTGQEIMISQAYLVSPFSISSEAITSVRGELRSLGGRLSALDGPALFDLIKLHLPRLLVSLETPERRFVHSLLLRLSASRTSQPLAPHRTTTLSDVYTAGALAPVSRDLAALGTFAAPPDLTDRCDIDTAVRATPHLVVAADVGAGKTSLLQMCALRLLKRADDTPSPLLPVLVPLHRLPHSAFHDDAIIPAFRSYLRADGLPDPDWDRPERLLLLLDGFDEVPFTDVDELRVFDCLARRFPSLVVTSRPSRLPRVPPHFAYYYLRPFDPGDVLTFLTKWFAGSRDLAVELARHISNDSVLRAFCRTPLMLTLVAILAERLPLARLPSRRTAIYGAIADLLLGQWDDIRGVANLYAPDLKAYLLEELGLAAHEKRLRRVTAAQLAKHAEAAIGLAAAKGSHQRPEALAREIIYRTSLLRRTADSQYEFCHLSFQEYFAARKLSRALTDLPGHYLYDDWWRGTCTFYFGIRRTLDDLPLTRQSKLRRAVALGAYLTEADYTSPATRSKVLRIIGWELLHGPTLDEGALRHYSVYGYELVALMATEVSRGVDSVDLPVSKGRDSVNLFNYVHLALVCNDERALSVIDVLSQLSPAGVITAMEIALSRLASPMGLPMLFRALRLIQRGPNLSLSAAYALCSRLATISTSLATVANAASVSREQQAILQEYLYNAARRLSSKPLPAYQPADLSHWGAFVSTAQ